MLDDLTHRGMYASVDYAIIALEYDLPQGITRNNACTAKPVCSDHLCNKTDYLWLIQC